MKFVSQDCLFWTWILTRELSHTEQNLYGVFGTDFCIRFQTLNNDYLQQRGHLVVLISMVGLICLIALTDSYLASMITYFHWSVI